MTEDAFIAHYEEKWKTLEDYNRRLVKHGLKTLDDREVKAFAHLFRLAGYHLAYCKTHFPNGQALPYLNRIVGVSHNFFYVREKGGLSDIQRYIVQTFPQAVIKTKRYFWAAFGLFSIGLFFTALYVASDTSRFYQFFPLDSFTGGTGSTGGTSWDYPLLSAYIMTNNIRVAATAFALGVLGGVGTVLVLLYNGCIIGALLGYLAATSGDMVTFLSLILPHGVWELAAIFLSGACGLMIGRAVLIPGMYTRKHALVKEAKNAARLLPGLVVMLVLAGLIEGFFTPLPIAPAYKFLFSGTALAGLLAYLLHGKIAISIRLPRAQ